MIESASITKTIKFYQLKLNDSELIRDFTEVYVIYISLLLFFFILTFYHSHILHLYGNGMKNV